MKKKNRVLSFALIVLAAIAGFTCKQNIGMGGTIDIERPRGEITYPNAGETPIRGSFVIEGWAKDDGGVRSISVRFKNKETGKELSVSYAAEPFQETAETISWTINVNNDPKGTEDGHPLVKVYPIPDGEYEALVTLTDKQGKTTVLNQTYKIDNTPPVFIVSRPSTIVRNEDDPSPSSGDGYGAVFSVVGQVGEKNTVEKLLVSVPEKNIDLTGMFVGKNINAQIAKFEDETTGAIYKSENNPNPLIPFKAHMYLYDNAREFKGGESVSVGNKAEWYYLSDAISVDVLSKGYTPEVISDYLAGKDGTGSDDDHNKSIRRLREDANALNVLKNAMTKMDEYYTTFRLDPRKSPGLRVVNINNLPKATLNPDEASSILFKDDVTTTIIVELMRNKDGTPLVKSTNLADVQASNIEIVLLKWNGNGNEVESFKKGSELDDRNAPPPPVDYETQANLTPIKLIKFADFTSQPQVDAVLSIQGGTLRVKCTLPSPFAEGKYLVKVKGTDIDKPTGNTFTAYDDSGAINDGVYIIKFLKNISGPRIRPHRIDGYHNASFEVKADITGLDGTSVVYYNIDVDVDAVPDPAKKLLPDSGNPQLYKATVPVGTLPDGDHEIHFLARNSSGGQDKVSTTFKVDRTAPEVKLNYPDINDPQVGEEIEIGGTITDFYAGVDPDKTKWMIVPNTSTPPTVTTTSGWKDMTQSTTGSWKFTADLNTIVGSVPQNYGTLETSGYYKIPVYILAQDKKGNKAVHTLHILFDKDGKKPVVKILSPKDNITTGGTIQLFGTAKAPKGGPSAVGGVYIQFSKNGNFTGGEDGKFGTSGTPSGYDNDWYKSNDGQLIPGSSGGEWSLDINKDGQFNPSGTNSHVVYYKLRAKHNDGTLGNWSETRKITIDKDTPVIRNVKIVQGSANERYESNMWIGNGNKFTAQLADGSGLKRVEISSQYLNGGFKYVKTTEAIAAGWTAMPSGWLTDFSENGESGYNLTLPIDNLQNIAAAAGGKFKIKIEIWENKTTAPLNTYSEYEFRFDTVAPSGSFGEYMLVNTANFGTDSINDGSIASAVTDYTADGGNINNLGMLIKNTPVKITSVSGSTVSFTPNIPEAGSCNYILYKKKTLIYNMGTSHWVIHGVANDDGSGIKEVRAKVKVGTASSAEAVISGTKISRQLGGQVSWSGSIDLHSLPDGVGTLHYQIIDASGNTYNVGDEYGGNASGPYNSITNPNPNRAISVTVKNKPIKVSKVTLKTKIGGFEKEFANSDTNGALTETTDRATAAKRDSTFDFVSSNFTFKDKDYSKIKVDFTGGEATVQYRLKKGDTVLQALTDLPVGGEINLENHLNTIGNSNGAVQELLLELWDAAKGLNQGATSAFAKITIKTLFEAIDKKPPVPAISPFYWSSEADNSLYQNSRKNGHIEIKEDLTGDFTASDGLMDKDDKVSGKISIRGTAHDDQVIKEILGHITSFTFVGITGAASGAETKLTEYDFSSKKFKDIGTVTNSYDPNDMSKPQRSDYADDEQYKAALDAFLKKRTDFFNANGWLFTITDSKFDVQTGHTVKWQLDWDSSKITDGVGTDKKITIKVKDQSTEPSHTVSAMRQVDVVPYITEVETAKRTNSGLSKNTIRASNGKYSVIKGSIADFIEVKGFNLQKGTETPVVKLVKADSIGTVTSNNSEGTAITPSSSSNTSFKISNDVNLSGYLEVFVDGVRAINNINANDKPYNKEEDAVLLKNKTLTDDCYLRLFDMKKTQISNGYYPEMIMDGNDPVFGLINPAGYQPSYGKTISFAWPLPALYQTQRIKFDSASGNIAMTGGIAQIEYIAGAINWDQFAMAKDTSNKYHYISVYNYNNAGMMYAYHSYAELEKSYMNKVGGWGAGSGYSGYNGKFAGEVGNNALVLDSLAYKTSSSILERYRYPKILAKGDSNTAAGASVYIAYYDAVNNDTTKQGIKFRSFKIGDNLTGGTRSMANTIKSNFDGYSVKIETSGNPSWRTWRGYFHPNDSNGRQEVGKGGSRFFDMGVTSDNHVVIVYFDEEEAKLKVKYSEIAIDGSNPTGTITWKDAAVTFPQYVGTYVSMDIDSNNGIHIAAFDSNDGDLKYFYLPSYNSSSLTSMTVDAAFSVGQWTQIKVRDGKPYIAYYSNTEAGQRSAIKLAVAEGTVTTTGNGGIGTVAAGVDEQGFVTGKWDCMTVPSVTPAQGGTPKFKKVNLGFDTSGRPVLGYLGENIEFGKWLDE